MSIVEVVILSKIYWVKTSMRVSSCFSSGCPIMSAISLSESAEVMASSILRREE